MIQSDVYGTEMIYRLLSSHWMFTSEEKYALSLDFTSNQFVNGQKLINKIGGVRVLLYGNLNNVEKTEFFPEGDPKISKDLDSSILTYHSFDLFDGKGVIYSAAS